MANQAHAFTYPTRPHTTTITLRVPERSPSRLVIKLPKFRESSWADAVKSVLRRRNGEWLHATGVAGVVEKLGVRGQAGNSESMRKSASRCLNRLCTGGKGYERKEVTSNGHRTVFFRKKRQT